MSRGTALRMAWGKGPVSREARGARASRSRLASTADITHPSEHAFLKSPDGTSECVAAWGSRKTPPIDAGWDSISALQVVSIRSSNITLH